MKSRGWRSGHGCGAGRAGRGPDRGRRKRRPGKIRGSAAEPKVRECLLRGGTLAEASRVFRDNTGYSVGKDSLSRYWRSVRAEMAGEKWLEVLAEAFARTRGGKLSGAAREMLQAQALEAAATLPDLALGGVSAERLVLVLARLARAGG